MAMCGGGTAPADAKQSTARNQCGGMGDMSKMDMDKKDMDKKDSAGKQAEVPAATDPHAGMDMGSGKKAGGGCCDCCGGMMGGGKGDGKAGGMCGKQAAITPEDGTGDPLLNDPGWNNQKNKSDDGRQSHAPQQH